MKKKILFTIIIASMMFMVGCGTTQSTVPVQDSIETTKETESTDTVSEEETTNEDTVSEEETEVVQRENTDFRNSCWGDDVETIKKFESDELVDELVDESETSIMYTSKLLTYDVYSLYVFDNNKLYMGGYIIQNKYTTGGQYISAYNNLKDALIKKYGEPSKDEIIPYDDQLTIDLAGESDALHYGMVAYCTEWKVDKTTITLGLHSENYQESLGITYKDNNYEENLDNSGL